MDTVTQVGALAGVVDEREVAGVERAHGGHEREPVPRRAGGVGVGLHFGDGAKDGERHGQHGR